MGYARYVGRVGALAVAPGIGVAVANVPAVAWADGDAGSSAGASGGSGSSGTPAGGSTGSDSSGARDSGGARTQPVTTARTAMMAPRATSRAEWSRAVSLIQVRRSPRRSGSQRASYDHAPAGASTHWIGGNKPSATQQ